MAKCEWIGRGEGCTKSAVDGRSYCEDHVWLVYQKGTALGRRKKDARRALTIWDLEGEINQAVTELEAEGVL